jgi:DNA-binding NarL/FixJ family response regulator
MVSTDKGMNGAKPTAAAFSVAIVEDHPEFRDALSEAVGRCPDMRLLPVCKDLPAAVSLLEQVCPDVLLVDLGLPSGSGLQLFHMVQAKAGARCAPAVLTVTGNEEHLLTAMGAGAKGYLFKSDREVDWCHSIRLLASGQSPLHATLAQTLLDRAGEPRVGSRDEATRTLLRYIAAGYTREEAADRLKVSPDTVGRRIRALYDAMALPRPNLSPREIQLLQLLNRGYPFKKCAELMGVSESTTKTQAARAYEKLSASNLQSALYEARQAGFLH